MMAFHDVLARASGFMVRLQLRQNRALQNRAGEPVQLRLCNFWDLLVAMVSQLTDQCHGMIALPQVHLPHCAVLTC